MSIFGLDYAWSHPPLSAMRSAGVRFVCRYLSWDATKNLNRAEAERLSAAGIWIVVVWETTTDRALSGRAGGAADAREAERQAKACGMPSGRPIYFAVDWDASAAQQPVINAYLDGAAAVLGHDRVGLYAGHGPVKRAFDAKKITYGWQTYAWSGGRWDGRAHIQQYRNGVNVGGADCDYDRAVKSDYGQWRVGATPEEDDMPTAKEIADAVMDAPVDTGDGKKPWKARTVLGHLEKTQDGIQASQAQMLSILSQLAEHAGAPVQVDLDAIVAGVLAGLSPEKIAAAIPDDIGEQVAEALAARLTARKEQ